MVFVEKVLPLQNKAKVLVVLLDRGEVLACCAQGPGCNASLGFGVWKEKNPEQYNKERKRTEESWPPSILLTEVSEGKTRKWQAEDY